jgi:hypothetical protein
MKKNCLWFGWPRVVSTGNRKALEKGWKKVEPAGKGDWTSWDEDKRPCGTVKNGDELGGGSERSGRDCTSRANRGEEETSRRGRRARAAAILMHRRPGVVGSFEGW